MSRYGVALPQVIYKAAVEHCHDLIAAVAREGAVPKGLREESLQKAVRKFYINQRNIPRTINEGWCEEFAGYVEDHLDGVSVEEAEGHLWVKWNGRHYDAECLEGVEHPKDLPVYKRMKWDPESAR